VKREQGITEAEWQGDHRGTETTEQRQKEIKDMHDAVVNLEAFLRQYSTGDDDQDSAAYVERMQGEQWPDNRGALKEFKKSIDEVEARHRASSTLVSKNKAGNPFRNDFNIHYKDPGWEANNSQNARGVQLKRIKQVFQKRKGKKDDGEDDGEGDDDGGDDGAAAAPPRSNRGDADAAAGGATRTPDDAVQRANDRLKTTVAADVQRMEQLDFDRFAIPAVFFVERKLQLVPAMASKHALFDFVGDGEGVWDLMMQNFVGGGPFAEKYLRIFDERRVDASTPPFLWCLKDRSAIADDVWSQTVVDLISEGHLRNLRGGMRQREVAAAADVANFETYRANWYNARYKWHALMNLGLTPIECLLACGEKNAGAADYLEFDNFAVLFVEKVLNPAEPSPQSGEETLLYSDANAIVLPISTDNSGDRLLNTPDCNDNSAMLFYEGSPKLCDYLAAQYGPTSQRDPANPLLILYRLAPDPESGGAAPSDGFQPEHRYRLLANTSTSGDDNAHRIVGRFNNVGHASGSKGRPLAVLAPSVRDERYAVPPPADGDRLRPHSRIDIAQLGDRGAQTDGVGRAVFLLPELTSQYLTNSRFVESAKDMAAKTAIRSLATTRSLAFGEVERYLELMDAIEGGSSQAGGSGDVLQRSVRAQRAKDYLDSVVGPICSFWKETRIDEDLESASSAHLGDYYVTLDWWARYSKEPGTPRPTIDWCGIARLAADVFVMLESAQAVLLRNTQQQRIMADLAPRSRRTSARPATMVDQVFAARVRGA